MVFNTENRTLASHSDKEFWMPIRVSPGKCMQEQDSRRRPSSAREPLCKIFRCYH